MLRSVANNKIVQAYGTSLLGVASGLLTNLWLLREITLIVPVADFGIYAYVLQLCAYLAILQLSLDFSASREIAESLGRNDARRANLAFLDLIRFNRRIAQVGVVIVVALSVTLWHGIGLNPAFDSEATHLAGEIALAAGASQLVSFFSRPYAAALIGSEFQAAVNVLTVARTVATTLLAFCFLKLGFYVFSVPAAEVLMQLLNLQVLRRMVKTKCDWKQSTYDCADNTRHETSWLRFGLLTSLGGVAWTIESGADVIILGYLTSVEIVAAYVIWWRFPMMLFDVCTRLSLSAFPQFAQRIGVSMEAARNLFSKVADLSAGLGTLAFVGISIWLQPFVQVWIGTAYAGEVGAYIPLLMGLLVCLRTCGNLLAMFWLAQGQATLTTAVGWSQALVKVAFAFLLVPDFGLTGLLLASCIAASMQVVTIAFYLLRNRLLPVSCIFRFGALMSLAAIISVIGVPYPQMVGWFGIIIGATATALVWGVIWWGIAWTGELRRTLQSLLTGIAKWLRSIGVA